MKYDFEAICYSYDHLCPLFLMHIKHVAPKCKQYTFFTASTILFVFLAQVCNAMIEYGMCAKSMTIGTMIPISKVKRQVVCNLDNFRAIALSSIVRKI